MKKNCVAGLSAVAALAAGAMAHEGDYGLLVQNGRIVTGIGDHDAGTITDIGERVFAAEMVDGFGGGAYADEPGIFIQPGTFAPGTGIGFNIMRSLRVWNVGTQDFFSVASHPMTLEFGPASATTPNADVMVGGFVVNYDGGDFDEHYDFTLPGGAGNGIYLLELQFFVTDPNIAASESVWTVFNWGLSEEEHEAAIHWVEENLVPSPASAVVLMGLLAAGRRRR